MSADLRKNAEPMLNEAALLKACLAGGLIVVLVWLGSIVFAPLPAGSLFWITVGAVVAAVLSAFIAARRCGLRRRADGVAHGVLAWVIMTTLASLALLPTVNALDLSGPGDGLYERFEILAAEAGTGSEPAAEREQLDRLLRGSGVETDASFLSELERAAITSDENSIRSVLQKRTQLKPEQLNSIVQHTLILYRDSQSMAADRAIIHDNIMETGRFAWLLLLVSLLLSMWAGARGVRVARTDVRT